MDQSGYREQSIPEGINLGRLLRYTAPRSWVVLVLGLVCAVVALIWALYIVPEYKGLTRFEVLTEAEGISLASQLPGVVPGGFLGENKGRPEVVRLMAIDLSRETLHEVGLEILVVDPRDTFLGRAKEKIGGRLGMKVRQTINLAPVRLGQIEMEDRLDGKHLHLVPQGAGEFELRDPDGIFEDNGAVVFTGREGDLVELEGLSFIVRRVPHEKEHTFDLLLRREAEWMRDFRSRLKAGTDRNANHIITVEFNHPYPEIARDVLNTLFAKYTDMLLRQRGESNQQQLAWINEELDRERLELAQAQKLFYDFREANKAVEFNTQVQVLIEQIAGYDLRVTENEFTMRGYDELLRSLEEGDTQSFMTSPFIVAREDLLLSNLVTQLSQAEVDRQALLQTLTERHPDVLEADARIAELQQSIRSHIVNSRDQLKSTVADMRGKQGVLEAEAEKLPSQERDLLELTRDYERQLGLVQFLEQQKTEKELSQAALLPNVRFIDEAEVGKQPFKPRVMMSVTAGAVLGLGAGVVALFFMFLGHVQVFDEEDAADSAPVLAVLNSRNWQARLPLLAGVMAGRGGGAGVMLSNTQGVDASDFAELLFEKARILGRRPLGLLKGGTPLAQALKSPLPAPPATISIADVEASSAALNQTAGMEWLKGAREQAEVVISAPPHVASSPLGQQIAMALGSCTLLAVRGLTRREDLAELARQLRLGGVHVIGVVLVDRSIVMRQNNKH